MVRGLDVFAGFIDESVGKPALPDGRDRAPTSGASGSTPCATCTLEGRTVPGAGASPSAARGDRTVRRWAVPDPAFQFTTRDRTVRQLSGWFRGTSAIRAAWERAYSGCRGRLPTGKPSALARKAASHLSSGEP